MTAPALDPTLDRRTLLRLAGAGGLVSAGLLTGCAGFDATTELPDVTGEYDGPPLTLRFWNGLTGGDGPVMRKLLAEFTSQHPNITVEMYALPWSNFYQKFPAAVASGLAPDLGLMHNFQVATNAVRGVITPVDSIMPTLGLTESDYPATVWQSGVLEGRRYSVPLDVWPDSLFYNRRVLGEAGLDPDRPPQTGDDYLAALETLRGKGIQGHWLPAVDPQGVGRGFDSLLWQHGGTHYDEAGSAALFDSDAGRAALNWQRTLIDSGFSPRNVSGSDGNTAFKNDKNAFLWGGPGALINDLGKVDDLDWGAAPLPRIGDQAAGFCGSHQFVITRQHRFDPARVSAVVTFLGWITQNSLGWAAAGPIPARLPVLRDPAFAELTAQASIARGIDAIRFYPLIPGIAEVQTTILYPAIGDALLGNLSVPDALATAARQARFLLEENLTKYRGH